MDRWARVEAASAGGPTTLVGRTSGTRAEWEVARSRDASDLNRLLESGGEVSAYVVPLWSNAEADRCLAELRGFDDAKVYAEPILGEGFDDALAAIAETEWIGASYRGEDLAVAAALIHSAAALEFPLFLPEVLADRAFALAIAEDLTPREIETALKGAGGEPDSDALDHARELLG
jgi:hypothetical protein